MGQVKYYVIRNFNGAFLSKDGTFTGFLSHAIASEDKGVMEELMSKLPTSEALEVVEIKFLEGENNS